MGKYNHLIEEKTRKTKVCPVLTKEMRTALQCKLRGKRTHDELDDVLSLITDTGSTSIFTGLIVYYFTFIQSYEMLRKSTIFSS